MRRRATAREKTNDKTDQGEVAVLLRGVGFFPSLGGAVVQRLPRSRDFRGPVGPFHTFARSTDARWKIEKLMPDLALFVIGVLVTALVAVAVGLVGLSDLVE